MRNYLFASGLFGAVTSGIAMLRGTRDAPVTWRAVLAWVSWGITVALAIGAIVDFRRDQRGEQVAYDSPVAPLQFKRAKKELKAAQKARKSGR
ncbi:conserved hypothetical protein [Microbacterium sp. 8M]|jgi:hypothetical protein|uniref:hypothetical protein n=1 Tax=Microbacterium sp. 8M TaxID=2653153 RepID=UPI0012EFD32D|nr:hypothetical protein [Microbacterium sp. 8M]VXB01935.1 conserved hypothetical protein [Microbacterium sp. 8M]